MAGIQDPRLMEQLVEAEQKLVELKRSKLPANKREYWMPRDGSGLIPEEQWKRFSPDSNPETAISYKWEVQEDDEPVHGLKIVHPNKLSKEENGSRRK